MQWEDTWGDGGGDSAERPAAPETHRTSTTETGPFCSAVCSCGWRGPARRARGRARADAAAHTEG
ncbi:hypothetical protein V1L54_25480 [Streptomyces sp. TRM 70361]|uniref:hypothetical protein n=1 Tax=Streptomyces sp. TRM 70361 TaxID=3116553 RepID=UPI002E7B3EB7|nr:hypothetical protein [Streptomyces sp. TRM 70361]MEE1942718.1 hypothetical protein [Streptomyces sp. TRM 70361]